MSAQRRAAEQLELLVDAYLADLLELSPQEMLDEPGTLAAEQKFFEEMVEKAKAEAGRRRLLRARQELEKKPLLNSGDLQEPIDIEAARKYIAAAANDKRFTLAARELRELSDEEVARIYVQLKYLENAGAKDT
jgi:hypothetical protein